MRISNEFTRRTLSGHGLLGLIFGVALYMICLSGTLIVLTEQLARWERPDAARIAHVDPHQLAAISRAAYARAHAAQADRAIFIRPPTADYPRMVIFANGVGEKNHEWSVDANGTLQDEIETPWVAFVEALHTNLTVPGALGRYLVGILGTVLLASLGTGILAHRRILKDAFRLRWGGSKRRSNADLHNRIGVWALPFHLIVSLTGSLLGLSGLIIFVLAMVAFKGDQEKAIASLLGPQASNDARAAPLPDVAAMIAQIEARVPGTDVTLLGFSHPGTVGQIVQIGTDAPGHLARNETWSFAGDGKLLEKSGYTDGNLGKRVYGMITPLHYGTYGGVALKLIYVALGAGLTTIIASGGNIWLARRREQGRAAPRFELLWAALIWGQPLILLLAAGASLAGVRPTFFYWAMTTALWLVALRLAPALLAKALRTAIAIAAIGLGAGHLVRSGAAEPVSVTIDIALLGIGLAILAPAIWLRVRRETTRRQSLQAV